MSGALRNVLCRQLKPNRVQIVQRANYDVISGPPQNRMSLTKKWTLASFMIVVITAPQFLLLANLKEEFSKNKPRQASED